MAGAVTVDSVRDVIDRRLARLSQPCIRMLTLAALDGTAVRPWLLARVLGDGPDLAALVEEAVAARVLVAEDGRVPAALRPRPVLRGPGGGPARPRPPRAATTTWAPPWRRPAPRVRWSTRPSWPRISGPPRPPGTPRPASVRCATRGRPPPRPPAGSPSTTPSLTSNAPWPLLDLGQPGPAARLALLLELADARRLAGRLAAAAATYRDAFAAARQLNDAADRGPRRHRPAPRGGEDRPVSRAGQPRRAAHRRRRGPRRPARAAGRAGARGAGPHAVPLARGRARWPGPSRSPSTRSSSPRDSGDPEATAEALLALHDVRWRPGQAEAAPGGARPPRRRPRPARMRAGCATSPGCSAPRPCSSSATPARSPRSRPTAPAADRLGDPTSRWQALSRRAAVELLAGRLDGAADLAVAGRAARRAARRRRRAVDRRHPALGAGPLHRRARRLPPQPARLPAAGRDVGPLAGADPRRRRRPRRRGRRAGRIHRRAGVGPRGQRRIRPVVPRDRRRGRRPLRDQRAARRPLRAARPLRRHAGRMRRLGRLLRRRGLLPGPARRRPGRRRRRRGPLRRRHRPAPAARRAPLGRAEPSSSATVSSSGPAGRDAAASGRPARSGSSRSAAPAPTSPTARGSTTSPCCSPAPASRCRPASWPA